MWVKRRPLDSQILGVDKTVGLLDFSAQRGDVERHICSSSPTGTWEATASSLRFHHPGSESTRESGWIEDCCSPLILVLEAASVKKSGHQSSGWSRPHGKMFPWTSSTSQAWVCTGPQSTHPGGFCGFEFSALIFP